MSRFTRRYYWSLAGVTRHSALYYLLFGWLQKTGRLLQRHMTFLAVVGVIALLLAAGYLLLLSSNLIERRLQADYGELIAKLRSENQMLHAEIEVLRNLRNDFVIAKKQEQFLGEASL